MDLKSTQKPLKERYAREASASHITLKARGGQTETPMACTVAIGRAICNAAAHTGVGSGPPRGDGINRIKAAGCGSRAAALR
jgi:hypothetical protein